MGLYILCYWDEIFISFDSFGIYFNGGNADFCDQVFRDEVNEPETITYESCFSNQIQYFTCHVRCIFISRKKDRNFPEHDWRFAVYLGHCLAVFAGTAFQFFKRVRSFEI